MRLACIAVLATVLVAAAGCDGDDDTPTPGATAPATSTAQPAPETLAFLRHGDIWLADSDGANERQLNLADVQAFSWISPDELAVVAEEDRSRHLLVDLDGRTEELPFAARGSWSPDGLRYTIAVGEEVIIYERDGTELSRLSPRPPAPRSCEGTLRNGDPDRVSLGAPAFAPDGESILVPISCFSLVGANTFFKPLVELSLDGELVQETSLMVNTSLPVRFSPDGAYVTQLDGFHLSACAFGARLTLANRSGEVLRSLQPAEIAPESDLTPSSTPRPTLSGGVFAFDWSPESDAVAAAVDTSLCVFTGSEPRIEPFVSGLYILSVDGTEERLVDGPARSPSWSPSGSYIAYEAASRLDEDTGTLRVLDLTTGSTTDVTIGGQPAWRPLN